MSIVRRIPTSQDPREPLLRRNAAAAVEQSLAAGKLIRPSPSSPFRTLARSCEMCGRLVSTPLHRVRSGSGVLPPCQHCHDRRQAEWTLRRGGMLSSPQSSPFRMLAWSCSCGTFRSCPPEVVVKRHGQLPPCRGCGRDKSSRHAKRQRAARNPAFLARTRQSTEARRRRVQVETADQARNVRKEWTGPELEIAARDDLSAAEVARMLGRTLYGVKHIRQLLRRDPRKITVAGVRLDTSG